MSTPTRTAVRTPDPGTHADVAAALDRLAALGSVTAIADFLLRGRIRGECGRPGRCAVAMFLVDAVPAVKRYPDLYVDSLSWSLEPWTGGATRFVPDLVGEFVVSFDHGHFPDLVVPGSPVGAPGLLGP